MNQIMGWAFTAIVILGIAAIALVAVWPRWRVRRVLDGAGGIGVRRLPRSSPEVSRVAEPPMRDLVHFGAGCRVTAAWELPIEGGFAVTIRCKYKVPRAGGTTTKYRVSTTLGTVRPLAVEAPFTVQPTFDPGPAGRFVAGLIERSLGVQHADEEGLDPGFRRTFTVRGAGFRHGPPLDAPQAPVVPPAFQETCLRSLEPAGPYPSLVRLMGQDGSLAVTAHGLALTLGENASPGKLQDVQALLALLDELGRTLSR